MPDRDVFTRHVERRWRSSARQAFLRQTPEVIEQLVTHAARDLGRQGCPGLVDFGDLVSQAYDASGDAGTLETIVARLDAICQRAGSNNTNRAARAARTILAAHQNGDAPAFDRSQLPRLVAVYFVSLFIESKVFSSTLTAELVESEAISNAGVAEKRRQLIECLNSSESVSRLALQLLEDPKGGKVTEKRERSKKPTLAELVFMPLTGSER